MLVQFNDPIKKSLNGEGEGELEQSSGFPYVYHVVLRRLVSDFISFPRSLFGSFFSVLSDGRRLRFGTDLTGSSQVEEIKRARKSL